MDRKGSVYSIVGRAVATVSSEFSAKVVQTRGEDSRWTHVDCLDAPNPPSSTVMGHYRRAGNLKPQNLVRMVVVTERGGFVETSGRIYESIARSEFLHFVQTIREAEALCDEILASASNKDQSQQDG